MKVNQKGMDALHRPSFFQSLNSKMSCPINDLPQSIGYTMSRLGFPKAHRSKGNGWWVIEKEDAEINTDALFSMADARSKGEGRK